MSRRTRKKRREVSRGGDPTRHVWLVVAIVAAGMSLGLLFIIWQGASVAEPPVVLRRNTTGVASEPATESPPVAQAPAAQPVSMSGQGPLLPLSDQGESVFGWHDMERIPDLEAPGRQVPADQPQADIMIIPPRHDFGVVGSKDVVSYTFAVQNTGSETLEVTNLVTSCGCTTAILTNNVIPPGTRADLTAVFDVGFHDLPAGDVLRAIWLETNDPDTPVAEARLTAIVQQ